ncbi:MAG: sugar phosphate isomerase/epimerase [Oscillospiraceae bacterium]|nr:sugar phosphate isomerase/epimerase [Oscillospiraceae bacterium]
MKVGIQLYSVKQHLMKDGLGTMKEVAKIGYKYIEPFSSSRFPVGEAEKGFGLGLARAEAKAFLNDTGIQIAGGHHSPVDYANFEAMCDYFAFLGAKNLGSAGSQYPGGKEELLRKIEIINKNAETAKKYGLRYYYHNHFWEYQKFDGKTVMEIIAENTDPGLVYFEQDNYWAARGGVDPVKEAEKLKGRLILMHQKDFAKDAGEPISLFDGRVDPNGPISLETHQQNRHVGTFAEVGNGVLPIQDYIDAGNRLGVEYILLEQDLTRIDEFDSIRISMEAFHKFSGIEWE